MPGHCKKVGIMWKIKETRLYHLYSGRNHDSSEYRSATCQPCVLGAFGLTSLGLGFLISHEDQVRSLMGKISENGEKARSRITQSPCCVGP